MDMGHGRFHIATNQMQFQKIQIDMGATDYYRNFSGVELTDFDDTWTVGSNDGGMTINALGGTNTLSGSLSNSASLGVSMLILIRSS